MRFFEKCRPEFYFHGGKLVKDAKSDKQYWRLNLVLTLKAEEVLCCDDVIRHNYLSIETREDHIEELKMATMIPQQAIEFFSLSDHQAPVMSVLRCDLADLRMTRDEDLTELWVRAEIENSDKLHQFVKGYVFQRLWVEFAPARGSLPGAALNAADRLTEGLRTREVTKLTISGGGETVELDKEDAERIHAAAKKKNRLQ